MTAAADILAALTERRMVEPRVAIVVAHPDDETIGMGAQLCRFRDALLIEATDGAPRDGHDARARGYATIADYAAARRGELAAALAAGAAAGVRSHMLGIADQEACRDLAALARRIAALLRAEPPQAVFVQPYEGGHPDHDAASFAVAAACRLIAAEAGTPPAIIEMTAYHASGSGVAAGVFLPASRAETDLTLAEDERARKRRMLECFISQHDILAGFEIAAERFREAPDYDFRQPPHAGELNYERLGWGITGAVWRGYAAEALDTLGLRAPR